MPTGDVIVRRVNIRTVYEVNSRAVKEHLADPKIDPLIKALIMLRVEKTISTEGLARQSLHTPGLSFSPTALRAWEGGRRSPALIYLRRWAQLLGKDLKIM